MSPRTRRILVATGVWLVIALPLWAFLFVHSSEPMVIAGHDVIVTPAYGEHSVLEMGPYLPDARIPTGGPVGVHIEVGKTTVDSVHKLLARYATIAAQPEPEIRHVRAVVLNIALNSGLRAAVIGLVPIGLWLLVGPRRREELVRPTLRRAVILTAAVGVAALAAFGPWHDPPDRVQDTTWVPLPQAIPEVAVPAELAQVELQGGLVTSNTKRLVKGAFDSYDESKAFYEEVQDKAATLGSSMHTPADDETVAVLVSDRHDNIGMDKVARTLAKVGHATVVIDAGDDTSTGEPWEAFSLDSLDDAFGDFDAKIAISGNHDHGTFVNSYLEKAGWTHLDGKPEKPFGEVRIFGIDDPRSSGLGTWRDTTGLTFDQVRDRMSAEVCRLDRNGERVATVVVHDANLAMPALREGCTDLILAGHLHRQVGPDREVGTNGQVGYRYTNGTTGGAAYAFAMGSKLRREAELTLVTYRDGRPVGLQPVRIEPGGQINVDPYTVLDLGPDAG